MALDQWCSCASLCRCVYHIVCITVVCVYLLQHAGGELHGLMVLLLQHVHVEVIQEVVPVVIQPALVQLRQRVARRLIRHTTLNFYLDGC